MSSEVDERSTAMQSLKLIQDFEKHDLKSINGVEIFSTGTWNGEEVKKEDLYEMVRAFESTKATFLPPIKLGHDDYQAAIQSDGMPAAGWINNLYIQGEKLVADIIDIPEKIYELLENKSYRNVSSEVFHNIQIGKDKFRRMLGAVALLGADIPAVMNLNDIISRFKIKGFTDQIIADRLSEYSYSNNEVTMAEKTEAHVRAELDLDNERKKLSDFASEHEKLKKDSEAELAELREFKKKAEVDLTESREKERVALSDKFISELEFNHLSTPAMRPYVLHLISGKTNYKIGDKEANAGESVKSLLTLAFAAAKVNFSEKTIRGESASDADTASALDKKIKDYAEKNKVRYADAYRAIVSEN